MIKLPYVGIWSLAVLLLCCDEIGVCFAGGGGSYGMQKAITWDDLMVTDRDHARVIVVDPNGGGNATTVVAAINMVPKQNSQRVKIHILPGVYKEKVRIPGTKPYISLIGDPKNPSRTVITGHAKASDPKKSGGERGTFGTATVSVQADYFCASGITFQNTAAGQIGKEGSQAVAMKLGGFRSVFYKSQFIGSQDTLLDFVGIHYFYKCFIQGSTDFISGNARSLYQECMISVVSPGYAIAAQKREAANQNTGFSFVNCTITSRNRTRPLLGRAWGKYSRIIYSFCNLDIDVMSGGWDDWGDSSRHNTAFFGEYKCNGRGAAGKTKRVPWSRKLSSEDAKPFLGKTFIGGQTWLKL